MNFNIFSKEYWDFKPNKEYINIFEGSANVISTKDEYNKQQDSIPGLLFDDPDIWHFCITIVVKNEIKNLFRMYNKTKSFSHYKLKGNRLTDNKWDLKVKGSGNIEFSINSDQQIVYSSQEQFTMRYVVEYF